MQVSVSAYDSGSRVYVEGLERFRRDIVTGRSQEQDKWLGIRMPWLGLGSGSGPGYQMGRARGRVRVRAAGAVGTVPEG